MTPPRGPRWRPRYLAIALLAVVLVIAGVIGGRVWLTLHQVLPGGGLTQPIDGRYNIALLGADSASWRDGARVDSTTIASIDATTGRTLLISVPRNLVLIPFPPSSPLAALYPTGYVCPDQATAPCMLTMVYQTGLDRADLYPHVPDPGAQATVEALEGITGLTINYYAFIDMDGFTALIDAIGGIDLTIRTRLPVGASGQAMYWIEPGRHHFSGSEALWYVRTRVGSDDYTRMARQKCLILATLDQLDASAIANHFMAVSAAASQTAHTNIPLSQVPTLAALSRQAMSWTVSGLSLTPPLVDPLRPDYAQIGHLVQSALAEVDGLDAGSPATSGPSTAATTDLTTTCGF